MTSYSMSHKPMTKDEFINLLHVVLAEKQKNKIEYIKPYDFVYDKCLLGYEISYAKKTYEENTFTFKRIETNNITIDAEGHLRSVIETLVKLYGKEHVVSILKDL